jgi:hypothetical protein
MEDQVFYRRLNKSVLWASALKAKDLLFYLTLIGEKPDSFDLLQIILIRSLPAKSHS